MAETSVGVAYLDIVPKLAEGFESKLSGAFAASSNSAIGKISATTRKIGAGLTAGVTAPLVALGTAAIKSFDQYDQALNRFSVSTGIHGQKLEKLGAQMRKTFSNATFASFDYEAIQAAFGAVTQKFDVTGVAAGRLSRKFLALGKVTGEDVPSLVEGSAKAFAAFNIPAKRTGDLIDFIWKTSQKIGVPFSELTSGALSSQVALQAMGLSLKQGIALIGNLTEAGVASPTGALKGIGTFVGKLLSPTAVGDLKDDIAAKQAAIDAILERSGASSLSQQRRVADIMARAKNGKLSKADQIDLSRARADYGTSSGSDAADLRQARLELAAVQSDLVALRKGQNDPNAAVAAIFRDIRQAETHNKALGIATKAFGSRAGGQLVNPIRRGQLDTKEFIKGIDSKKGGVEDDAKQLVTFSDSITAFKRQISNALIPLGAEIVKVFKSMKPQIKDFVGFIKDLAKRFGDLSPQVKKVVVVIGLLAAALGPALIFLGTIAPVVAAITVPMVILAAGIGALVIGFGFLWHRSGPLIAALYALGVAALAFGLSLGPIAFTIAGLELPFIAVAGVALALGAAFVWVSKHTRVIGHAFGAVKVVIGKMIGFIIDGIIWLVKDFAKAIHTMLQIASHLPGVGGYFGRLRDSFDKLTKSVVGGLEKQSDRFHGWENKVKGSITRVTGVIQRLMVTTKEWTKQVAAGLAQAGRAEGILSVVSAREQDQQRVTQAELRQRYRGSKGIRRANRGLAAGGPALAGTSYLVGEYEPEILTMGSLSGNVSHIKKGSANAGGGHTFNIVANDPKAVVREIEKYLDKDSERNGHHDKWHNRRFVG